MKLESLRLEEKMMQSRLENRVTHIIMDRVIKGIRINRIELSLNLFFRKHLLSGEIIRQYYFIS